MRLNSEPADWKSLPFFRRAFLAARNDQHRQVEQLGERPFVARRDNSLHHESCIQKSISPERDPQLQTALVVTFYLRSVAV